METEMATDDIKPKPEMLRILQAMFNTKEGIMSIEEITEMLQCPQQEAEHYIDKLEGKTWVEYAINTPGHCYRLTPQGREYWMETGRNISIS